MRLDLEKSVGAGSDLPGVPWKQVRERCPMRELRDVQHGICGQVNQRGIRSEKEKREMSESKSSGGIGFCGLLTIVFIVMKLLGKITWPWIWVLCPLWAGVAVFILVLLVLFILGVVFK